MSPELETLDQLLGGDLRLKVIRSLYPNVQAFAQAICSMLCDGDVRLLSVDGTDVPRWRWRELFEQEAVDRELAGWVLSITEQGGQRIGG